MDSAFSTTYFHGTKATLLIELPILQAEDAKMVQSQNAEYVLCVGKTDTTMCCRFGISAGK